MSKKYFIHSTAAGCTSNLWESAVYDDYFKAQGMQRVNRANEADVLVVNTCAVTPGFEDQSEKYINKMINSQLGTDADNKKLVIAGCYSAIRTEKIEEQFSHGNQVTHIKPVEMEKLANSLGLPFEKSYKPIETNHFDGINHCDSSLAHKIVWSVRKIIHTAYQILAIKKSYLLNFLDAMIFNEEFFVIDVGHGCAGGCSFCSIKQSRGFIKSEGDSVILKNLKRGLDEGHKDFWLLATDIGAWGLDRNQNPGDLLEPIYNLKDEFRVVLNYLEPRWLLHHESLHKFLKDKRTIGVAVPIQSGSTRLVYHSGRRYDPKVVADCVSAIKEKNPNLIVKTDIIVGLPSETWADFWDSVRAVFKFDVVVPVVFGVRPGTRAEKDSEHISLPVKWLRMGILSAVAISWQGYLCGSSLVKDLLAALTPNGTGRSRVQHNIN